MVLSGVTSHYLSGVKKQFKSRNGGSFAALAEADKVEAVIEKLNKEYYDKHGYQHLARVYKPARGSSVEF